MFFSKRKSNSILPILSDCLRKPCKTAKLSKCKKYRPILVLIFFVISSNDILSVKRI